MGGAGGERRDARALVPDGWGHGKARPASQQHEASGGMNADTR